MKVKKTFGGIEFFPVPVFGDRSWLFGVSESFFLTRYNLPNIPEKFEKIGYGVLNERKPLPQLNEKVDRNKAIRAVETWSKSRTVPRDLVLATISYAIWLWTSKDL